MGNSPGEVYGFEFRGKVSDDTLAKYLKCHKIEMVNNLTPGIKRVIVNLRDMGDRTKVEQMEPGVFKMTFVEPDYS